jgi:hypothetical protein
MTSVARQYQPSLAPLNSHFLRMVLPHYRKKDRSTHPSFRICQRPSAA